MPIPPPPRIGADPEELCGVGVGVGTGHPSASSRGRSLIASAIQISARAARPIARGTATPVLRACARSIACRAPNREHGLVVHAAFDHGRVWEKIHYRLAGRTMLRPDFATRLMLEIRPERSVLRQNFRRLVLASALPYRGAMGDLDRLVPSGIIEQWVYHLRRQRSRATRRDLADRPGVYPARRAGRRPVDTTPPRDGGRSRKPWSRK